MATTRHREEQNLRFNTSLKTTLEIAADLEYLHFAGGEPFLIPIHLDFISKLVDLRVSNKIILSYNTNMTVLPEKMLELWKHFKAIEVCISLDGTEKVNHYIRYPSDWKKIQKNITTLCGRKESPHISQINYNLTVWVYNIFNLPELVEFLIKEYPQSNLPLLSPLFFPEIFSIRILPINMKQNLTLLWT